MNSIIKNILVVVAIIVLTIPGVFCREISQFVYNEVGFGAGAFVWFVSLVGSIASVTTIVMLTFDRNN